jgi:hypothetical protein
MSREALKRCKDKPKPLHLASKLARANREFHDNNRVGSMDWDLLHTRAQKRNVGYVFQFRFRFFFYFFFFFLFGFGFGIEFFFFFLPVSVLVSVSVSVLFSASVSN